MMMTPAGLLKNMFLNKNAISPWQTETAQEHYGTIFKAIALPIFKVPLSLKYICVQKPLQVWFIAQAQMCLIHNLQQKQKAKVQT